MNETRTGAGQVNKSRRTIVNMRATSLLLALAVLGGPLAAPALHAQSGGLFAPVVMVNGRAVSRYELDQRERFLTLLRFPGDVKTEAETGLIEDRLRLEAAKKAGVTVSPDDLKAGMEEFASRANLTLDQFVTALGQGGVSAETYRDFVEAGLAWRAVIRARYADRVVISPSELRSARSIEQGRGAGPRVLVSEILIPVRGRNVEAANRLATELSKTITSDAAFAAAARKHSAAGSRDQGGQLGWIPLTNLPPQAQAAIATMRQGQVSPPIVMENAVALFRLRGVQQGGPIRPADISVDYALYVVPGGQAEAAQVQARADTCDDLYTVARGLPAGRLTRTTAMQSQLPGDIAAALAGLDENESAVIARGGAPVMVMLCDRSATGLKSADAKSRGTQADPEAPMIDPALGFGSGPGDGPLTDELRNQRLALLAAAYMAELKANADIRKP